MDDLRLRNRLFPAARDEERPAMIDTVKDSRNGGFGEKAHAVLADAFRAWSSLSEFRDNADRYKNYVFGDQLGDKIRHKGKWMTERAAIKAQGGIPLTNNRLNGMLRTIKGVFQQSRTEPIALSTARRGQELGEVMSATLQYVYRNNQTWLLDSAALTDMLVSGLCCFKTTFGRRHDKVDVWSDAISHNRFFFDGNTEDVRQTDVSMLGEIEDLGLYDVMARYADGSPRKADWIRQQYSHVDADYIQGIMQSYSVEFSESSLRDFFIADSNTRCRVITVWRKEAKERYLVHDTLSGDYYKVEISDEPQLRGENERRIAEQSSAGVLPEDMKLLRYQWLVDTYWYFYALTPQGEVLQQGETPYWHKSHPYSFRLYQYYDKQVFPFMSGFIDQQRYINRLIQLQDFMMRASAKGVLLIPKQFLESSGCKIEEVANKWQEFDGVIAYEAKPGVEPPRQITAASTGLGIYEMLQVQLKMLEDVSGIQGALQGQQALSGTPATLYAQQVQNASTSLTDIFESFKTLREERDLKTLKLIQQFYDAPRMITDSANRQKYVMYDPTKVRDAEFELSISESPSSPVYRMVINDMLMQLLHMGQIQINELLEVGAFPFADKFKQMLESRSTGGYDSIDSKDSRAGSLQGAGADYEAIRQEIGNRANQRAVGMISG